MAVWLGGGGPSRGYGGYDASCWIVCGLMGDVIRVGVRVLQQPHEAVHV